MLKDPSGSSNPGKTVNVYAKSERQAMDRLLKANDKYEIDPDSKLREIPASGYSCPNCKSPYTNSKTAMGCVIMIIICVSLGLGLIMIPFLPKDCDCEFCGHKWRA